MATYGGSSKTSQITQNNSSRESSSTSSSIRASAQRLKASQIPPGKLTVPQKDLLVFFRQLSVILQSGVALAQGLVLIAENMTNQKLAACVQRIARRLNAGDELSECLKEYPKVFAFLA